MQEWWLGVTFEVDDIIRRWQAPVHVLVDGPMTMPAALALFYSAPEDHPQWFLAHPDVIVTGLDERGERRPIDHAVFVGPHHLDLIGNAVSTCDGRFHWSHVMVALAEAAPEMAGAAPESRRWPGRHRRAGDGRGGAGEPEMAEAAIDAGSGPDGSSAPAGSTLGLPRARGVKPSKCAAAIDWLLKVHPLGVPSGVKNAALLADVWAATGLRMDETTLRRAMKKIRQNPGN